MDTETILPVFLPGRHFDVRITRSDFEDMVRAPIESTIGALSRTLRSAQVQPADLSAVLLVGGSSRIPLVAQMVSAELGRPTVVDTHPKYAVVLSQGEICGSVADVPEVATLGEKLPPLARPHAVAVLPQTLRTVISGTGHRRHRATVTQTVTLGRPLDHAHQLCRRPSRLAAVRHEISQARHPRMSRRVWPRCPRPHDWG